VCESIFALTRHSLPALYLARTTTTTTTTTTSLLVMHFPGEYQMLGCLAFESEACWIFCPPDFVFRLMQRHVPWALLLARSLFPTSEGACCIDKQQCKLRAECADWLLSSCTTCPPILLRPPSASLRLVFDTRLTDCTSLQLFSAVLSSSSLTANTQIYTRSGLMDTCPRAAT
jgi:hypothetical protein